MTRPGTSLWLRRSATMTSATPMRSSSFRGSGVGRRSALAQSHRRPSDRPRQRGRRAAAAPTAPQPGRPAAGARRRQRRSSHPRTRLAIRDFRPAGAPSSAPDARAGARVAGPENVSRSDARESTLRPRPLRGRSAAPAATGVKCIGGRHLRTRSGAESPARPASLLEGHWATMDSSAPMLVPPASRRAT